MRLQVKNLSHHGGNTLLCKLASVSALVELLGRLSYTLFSGLFRDFTMQAEQSGCSGVSGVS